MLWKWLNPQNFLDLADIFSHQKDYAMLIQQLETHTEAVQNHILGIISQYATDEMIRKPFHDRVSFTVGWGISGWATAATGGINDLLLTTLIHETFHRFQLQVCPAPAQSRKKSISFEDLTRYPFPDERDRKFCEILSHLFLEGTATFIALSHRPVDWQTSAQQGAPSFFWRYALMEAPTKIRLSSKLIAKVRKLAKNMESSRLAKGNQRRERQ